MCQRVLPTRFRVVWHLDGTRPHAKHARWHPATLVSMAVNYFRHPTELQIVDRFLWNQSCQRTSESNPRCLRRLCRETWNLFVHGEDL